MMTSRKQWFAAILFTLGLASSAAFAANINNATATATVASSLSIAETTPLSFGTFTAGSSQGTITTAGVGSNGVAPIGTGATPGVFTLTGAPNTNVTQISGDGVSTPITLSGPSGATMDANLVYPASATIGTGGTGTFDVTGTLNVGANQTTGVYTGTYGVTVDY